jgi:hypothetical protein
VRYKNGREGEVFALKALGIGKWFYIYWLRWMSALFEFDFCFVDMTSEY